jgi:hypothetical protein
MSDPVLPPPPLPIPGLITYVTRTSAIETARTFELGADALTVHFHARSPTTSPAPASEVIRLADIREIRLRYFPTRVQTNRYECIITSRRGRVLKLTNEYYQGIMSFRDESAAYRTFVTALAGRMNACNSTALFLRGRTTAAFILEFGFLGLMFALLALVMLTLGPGGPLVWVKLAIVACFVPVLVRYARKNVPQPFDPRTVPADILPAA